MNDGSMLNLVIPCGNIPSIPSRNDLEILNLESSTDAIKTPIAIDQNEDFFIHLPDDVRVEAGFLLEVNTLDDKEIKYITIIENTNPVPSISNTSTPYLYSLEV